MEEENQLGKAAAFLPLFFSPFRAGGAEQSRADELAMSGRGLCADTHMDYNNRSFTVTTLDKHCRFRLSGLPLCVHAWRLAA
jgi:hypothetical protein